MNSLVSIFDRYQGLKFGLHPKCFIINYREDATSMLSKCTCAEKALESIIWQQYLLSRGANKQLHHYRETPREPEVSREQHTINLDGSHLCQMLFVSDTDLGEFVISSQVSCLLIHCSVVLKAHSTPNWTVLPFCRDNNLFSMITQKERVKNKGSNAFYSVITMALQSFNWVVLSVFSVGLVLNATKHLESWKLKWVFQWLICSQSRQAVASVQQRRLNHCFCI